MNKSNKNISLFIIIVFLFGISMGYALINRTLNITGSMEVMQNTWDIHFENVSVTSGSIEALKDPVIENSNLLVDFNVMLNLPGDFYEFTVEVHNDGSIDAMVDSIVKTPELTDNQKKYMNYIVEYQNGEQIVPKQILSVGEFVKLKVRVEFRNDVAESDMPTTNDVLNLSFKINYIQADDTSINVKDNGLWTITANGSLDEIGTIVTIGTEKFYTIGLEGDNVKLLSMYNLYVGGEYNSKWVAYGTDATGLQDETMRGTVSGQTIRKGVVEFSSATQKGIKYSDYQGSIVEGYVNNYKTELEKLGAQVIEARLISLDELTSSDIGCSSSSCSSALDWITSSTYWTGTAKDDTFIWFVNSNGALNSYAYYFGTGIGVRPVIVIPKNSINVNI